MAVLPTFSLVSIFCPRWHCSPTAALSAHRNDPDHRFSWRSCQLQYRQLSTSPLLPITILPTSITTRPAAKGALNIQSFSHEQKSRSAPICDLITSSRQRPLRSGYHMCDTHLKLSQALPLCTCGEDLNRILPFFWPFGIFWHASYLAVLTPEPSDNAKRLICREMRSYIDS